MFVDPDSLKVKYLIFMDSFHEYNNSYKFGLSTIHPQSSHSTKVSFGDQFFSKPSIGLEIPHH